MRRKYSILRFVVIVFFFLLLPLSTPAGDDSEELFPELIEELNRIDSEKESRAWALGNQNNLSEIFHRELKKSGHRWRAHLMRFIGKSYLRHRHAALYLIYPEYLHGNRPHPITALPIWKWEKTWPPGWIITFCPAISGSIPGPGTPKEF